MKNVLITGCSSGFGYLSALYFARHNWEVFAAVRNFGAGSEDLRKIAQQEKLSLHVIRIDVTNDEQINQEVKHILHTYNHIDVLVNNAGFGYLGPVEEFDLAEIQELYDVNIFGAVRLIKAVLPSMRQNHSGRIINVSSVNGRLSFGLYGMYSSSKFALETISESLRFEVKPFGVDVTVVEPGAFLTRFSENSRFARTYHSKNTAYTGLKDPLSNDSPSKQRLRQNDLIQKLINPDRVAQRLFEIANVTHTRVRYEIGIDTRLYIFIHRLVPNWLWETILHMAYKW